MSKDDIQNSEIDSIKYEKHNLENCMRDLITVKFTDFYSVKLVKDNIHKTVIRVCEVITWFVRLCLGW